MIDLEPTTTAIRRNGCALMVGAVVLAGLLIAAYAEHELREATRYWRARQIERSVPHVSR